MLFRFQKQKDLLHKKKRLSFLDSLFLFLFSNANYNNPKIVDSAFAAVVSVLALDDVLIPDNAFADVTNPS